LRARSIKIDVCHPEVSHAHFCTYVEEVTFYADRDFISQGERRGGHNSLAGGARTEDGRKLPVMVLRASNVAQNVAQWCASNAGHGLLKTARQGRAVAARRFFVAGVAARSFCRTCPNFRESYFE
jgi:hypothetical protein